MEYENYYELRFFEVDPELKIRRGIRRKGKVIFRIDNPDTLLSQVSAWADKVWGGSLQIESLRRIKLHVVELNGGY